MDIKKFIEGADAAMQMARSGYHVTLGKLVEHLTNAEQNKLVRISSSAKSVTDPHSYRGYYSDLALTPCDHDITAGELLASLKSILGKTLRGYKGGYFTMVEDTPLWVSSHGEASQIAIIDIIEDGTAIRLVTKLI